MQTGQKLLMIRTSKIPQEQQFSVSTRLALSSHLARSAIPLLPRMITIICSGCRASLFSLLGIFEWDVLPLLYHLKKKNKSEDASVSE